MVETTSFKNIQSSNLNLLNIHLEQYIKNGYKIIEKYAMRTEGKHENNIYFISLSKILK